MWIFIYGFAIWPQLMIGWKKPFNQPAQLAARVLAPGDGEAEPGVTATIVGEPAKLATDPSRAIFARFICRPLRGLGCVGFGFPRLGFAIAWG